MNTYKEKSIKAFNKHAKDYDTTTFGEHARMLYPAMLEVITHSLGDIVLDVGCGTGALLKQVYDEDHSRKLYGLDISKEMISISKERLQDKAIIKLGDSESLPFKDNYFDIVYCNDSFHHYPNPDKMLAETYRVLRYGGKCIIGECYLPFIVRNIMNITMKYNQEGDVKMYSKKELEKLLGKYFHAIEWIKIGGKACIIYGIK